MKRLIVLTSIALIAAFVASAAAQPSSYRYIKPSAFDKDVRLLVSGKSRHYFVMDSASVVEITVKGPSKLKVMSRALLESAEAQPEYVIEYSVDDAKSAKSFSLQSRAAADALFEGAQDGALGVLRGHVLEVPRGSHTYRFRLPDGDDRTLYLRFSQKTNEFTGGTPVVAMTPFEFSTAVDLVSREESYTYYRVGSNDRVVLKLVGPAVLKVLSRIEFDSSMQGKQKWKVQVLEDGTERHVYNLSAVKSEVNTYREVANFVPSRAETFYLEIPQGEHIYEFKLPENHRTSIFRFLLPKAQLGNDR